MSENGQSAVKDEVQIPIVRDSTFVRFVADTAAFTEVGRDMEVAFLQLGRVHSHQQRNGKFEEYEGDVVLTEVARMRIGFPDMLGVAMNFLRGGIIEGQLKGDAVRNTLDEWIAEASMRDDAGPNDE